MVACDDCMRTFDGTLPEHLELYHPVRFRKVRRTQNEAIKKVQELNQAYYRATSKNGW